MKKMFSVTSFAFLMLLPTLSFADQNKLIRMRALSVMPDESGKPSAVGGKVGLTDSAVPEIDFSYFFNDSFALELIVATTQHRAAANNTSLGNLDLGDVNLLPPTLLAQYHHNWEKWKPYIGAGVNYTIFYNQEPGIARSVRYTNSFGLAWQIGTDYKITDSIYLNVDIKKLYVSTDVEVNTYSNGTVKADVDINPWLVGMGLGYRF